MKPFTSTEALAHTPMCAFLSDGKDDGQNSAVIPTPFVTRELDHSIHGLEFSACGKYIATEGVKYLSGPIMSVRDASTGKRLFRSTISYDSTVIRMEWSPVGASLVFIPSDGYIGLWSPVIAAAPRRYVLNPAAEGNVTRFDWSPCGSRLAVLLYAGRHVDFEMSVWRLKDASDLIQVWSQTVSCDVFEWSPCGTRLAYVTRRGTYVVRFDRDTTSTRRVSGVDPSVLAWSPFGSMLAYGMTNDVGVIHLEDESSSRAFGPTGLVARSLFWTCDGSTLLSKSDAAVTAWDITSGRNLATVELFAHQEFLWYPKIDWLVCLTDSGFIVYNPRTGKAERELRLRTGTSRMSITISPWGDVLMTSVATRTGGHRALTYIDRSSGRVHSGPTMPMRCLTWSPCGSRFASADGSVMYLWDTTPCKRMSARIDRRSK